MTVPAPKAEAAGLVERPWSFDADNDNIELHNAPIFKLYRADDFPCIEDEDRAEADVDYLAHAQVVVMLLNMVATTTAPTTGEAVADLLRAQATRLAELEQRLELTGEFKDGPDGIECRNDTIKILDGNCERLRAKVAEQEKLLAKAASTMERCCEIVDRNLYRQHEKVEDIPRLLRSALQAITTPTAEGGENG